MHHVVYDPRAFQKERVLPAIVFFSRPVQGGAVCGVAGGGTGQPAFILLFRTLTKPAHMKHPSPRLLATLLAPPHTYTTLFAPGVYLPAPPLWVLAH